jgi:hypothetical protein
MKTYLVVTAAVFGLLVVAHIWRMIVETGSGTHNPWFVAITIAAAALCLWSVRLLMRRPSA